MRKREQLYTLTTNQESLPVVVTKLLDHLELTRYDQRGILEGAIHGFSQKEDTMLLTSREITVGTTTGKEIYYKVKHPMLDRYSTVIQGTYSRQSFFLETENDQGMQIKEQFFNPINIEV